MFSEAPSRQNDEIADCGLAIAGYQRECLFNPKSAIWLRPNAALGSFA
jgi:hypothetical protein